MKQRLQFFLVLACALFSSRLAVAQAEPSAQGAAIIQDVMRSLDGMITLQCRVKRLERVNGEMESGDIRVKVNSTPHKIYIYNVSPNDGTEVLWAENWNNGNAFIHPNGFPWINVSLSPEGGQMLKDQHHSMKTTGFGCIKNVLKHLLRTYKTQLDKLVAYVGKEKWYGKPHDVVKITYPEYKFVNYTVQPGEDLLKIDAKLGVPSYKILELNPSIDDYFDVTPGQVIKVPNAYGKEIVLVIDPDTHLPVVQLIYDDKGLFEKYEYSEVKVNPRFSTMEFSEENEAYGF